MHHRRSRTTRREVKRMDNKSYRKAEERALTKGSEDHPPQDRWGFRPEPLPLGDVPCNGKRHGKKKQRKAKDKCPVNRVHEWYKEDVTVLEWVYPYDWQNRRPYQVENKYHIETCIHCWKEKKQRVYEHKHWWSSRYKLVLPKRPVRF